jgi:glutaconyl-CoA/methylmalonyl-CoA decarboxylase subunit gamma
MKRYNITVNGKNYEVAVEEIGAHPTVSAAIHRPAPETEAPVAVPAPTAAADPTAAPAITASRPGTTTIKAPMPGTVLSFSVAQGQVVQRGDVVLILEAMKMENEIVASADGTIAALRVAPGASVNTGDPLIDLA